MSRSDQWELAPQFETIGDGFNDGHRFFEAFCSGDLTQKELLNIFEVRLMLREANPTVRNSSDAAF